MGQNSANPHQDLLVPSREEGPKVLVLAVDVECQEPSSVGVFLLVLEDVHLGYLAERAEGSLDVGDQGLGENNMSYHRVLTFLEFPGLTQLKYALDSKSLSLRSL